METSEAYLNSMPGIAPMVNWTPTPNAFQYAQTQVVQFGVSYLTPSPWPTLQIASKLVIGDPQWHGERLGAWSDMGGEGLYLRTVYGMSAQPVWRYVPAETPSDAPGMVRLVVIYVDSDRPLRGRMVELIRFPSRWTIPRSVWTDRVVVVRPQWADRQRIYRLTAGQDRYALHVTAYRLTVADASQRIEPLIMSLKYALAP